MKQKIEHYDVVVCGGGLAGFCAAVAAARHGATTCLIHDRPVFGGNSSSEIRVTTHGAAAFHAYARESGIVSELLIQERALNHEFINENGWTNSVWDMVMYDMAVSTPNLTFHLNTSVQETKMKNKRSIEAVVCRTANAEIEMTVYGNTFIDCTGDGVIADMAGCEWRLGEEARAEFDEMFAPEQASSNVMGSSIHFKAIDMGRPSPFKAPEWAYHYEDASFFYKMGRPLFNTGLTDRYRSGYWWIEIGMPWDSIYDNEEIRHQLTRHTLGVWDWIKNKDPKLKEIFANYALDWIGQVPGKRESRRIMGQYLMTERDALHHTVFPDEVAFGGWNIDLHTPGGLLAPTSEPGAAEGYALVSDFMRKSICGPYGIPLRMLIAKDVDNLMMAGRNVSATHAALGTVRVIGTTAVMGQAVGTAAALAASKGISAADVPEKAIAELQQLLLRDHCFLPNVKNEDPLDLALSAAITASSEAKFAGISPDTAGYHEGLNVWLSQLQTSHTDLLMKRRGQWIAVATCKLDSLQVCVSNNTQQTEYVKAYVMQADSIWDYRIGAPQLAHATLEVPPGAHQWVEWKVELSAAAGLQPGTYIRLDLDENPNVEWHRAGKIEPGHVCGFDMGGGKMRRYDNGISMSVQVDPPQPCYSAANVVSGYTRPYRYTNLWRSEPDTHPLPQWLELSWEEEHNISTVELAFAGNLLREYHAYEPFYRDPQCVRDYTISVWVDGEWRELLACEGNYQHKRVHRFDRPVATNKVRITVLATNGDPSAAIYEVRCYE
ncbi:FAD-dependent oxidoreductase [Paenibacillus thalictri]|uniref:FAD-dependent oxidoreductase n=1 Tax=Paenibacillus thalictri TaxID=2527873 RepID=A0A4Q9DXX6_9BACL|nr:FAD-dependent oxidoreductase [Paenibacillus thalictri]TBL81979.1 FAD-dependent oxidoreductase [Paenibacillus thalictri]